jgi:hypothetical protein
MVADVMDRLRRNIITWRILVHPNQTFNVLTDYISVCWFHFISILGCIRRVRHFEMSIDEALALEDER